MRIWGFYAIILIFSAVWAQAQISYRLRLATQVSAGSDTLYVSVFAFRAVGSSAFAFGSSNLLFDFDTASLHINQNGLLAPGRWSDNTLAGGNPLLYFPMLLGRGAQSNFLNLQIRQRVDASASGIILPDNQDILIARLWVRIKNCRAVSTFRWKTSTPGVGVITTYQNQQIRSLGTFINPVSGPLHQPLLVPLPVFSLGSNSINFSWPGQPLATGYRISVNNGQSWRNIGLVWSFDTVGLVSGDSVRLLVEALSGCDSARSVPITARLPGCSVFPAAPLAAADTGRCGFGAMVLKASGSPSGYRWFRAGVGLLAGRVSDTLNIALNGVVDTFFVVSITALGCQSQSRTQIIVRAGAAVPLASIAFLDSACSGQPFQISALGAASGQTYGWQMPTGMSIISTNLDSSLIGVIANLPGLFPVITKLKNRFCSSSLQTQISIIAGSGVQIISAPADSTSINLPIGFSTPNPYKSYLWDFGDGQFSSLAAPTHQYAALGTYTIKLKVSQSAGRCPDSNTINYKITEPSVVFVPNVFAPASQNIENRSLKIYGNNIAEQNFVFRIYNRWGELVWQTNSFLQASQSGWDGQFKGANPQNYNTYTYILRGNFNSGKKFDKTGTVMLID